MDKMNIDDLGKIRFYPDLNEYNIYKTYPKNSDIELEKKQETLEDLIDKYGLENWWDSAKIKKVNYNYSNISSVQDAIKVFGFKAIFIEFLKDHDVDTILNMLDIKDIQKYLRKKKIEELQK